MNGGMWSTGDVLSLCVAVAGFCLSMGITLAKFAGLGQRVKNLERGQVRQGIRVGRLETRAAVETAVARARAGTPIEGVALAVPVPVESEGSE
jgi:hypothetical protein